MRGTEVFEGLRMMTFRAFWVAGGGAGCANRGAASDRWRRSSGRFAAGAPGIREGQSRSCGPSAKAAGGGISLGTQRRSRHPKSAGTCIGGLAESSAFQWHIHRCVERLMGGARQPLCRIG
jgi:hypothetical protein